MKVLEAIAVRPLEDQFLDDVIRIHQTGLGYTFNSRLGKRHLAFLYRAMSQDSLCYVGVALLQNRPIGIVSGTVDPDSIKSRLLKKITLYEIGNIALRLSLQPALAIALWKSYKIGGPVYLETQKVQAILTAIAVDPEFQALGVGKQLVAALETFFAKREIPAYRLDTLMSNQQAREFYKRLGFCTIESRADSVILVKEIRQ